MLRKSQNISMRCLGLTEALSSSLILLPCTSCDMTVVGADLSEGTFELSPTNRLREQVLSHVDEQGHRLGVSPSTMQNMRWTQVVACSGGSRRSEARGSHNDSPGGSTKRTHHTSCSIRCDSRRCRWLADDQRAVQRFTNTVRVAG